MVCARKEQQRVALERVVQARRRQRWTHVCRAREQSTETSDDVALRDCIL